MKKRIYNWLTRHLVGGCLICLFVLLIYDAYYAVSYVGGFLDGADYVFCIIDTAVIAPCFIIMMLAIRKRKIETFIETLLKEAEKHYFHGFKLSLYVSTHAFWRFQHWLGSGRCYAFSVLAMIMLKSNKTATLYRGDSYNKDGQLKTRHSWVEFKIPMNGWWVADFTWIYAGFAPKKKFFKAINADGGRLDVKWSCSYDEFWNTPFIGAICEAMENTTTSNIYLNLSLFGNPKDEDYGFTEYCYSEEIIKHAACEYMIPYYNPNDEKFISSQIIRDFIKNPKRKQPKTRSIRLARFVVRRYKKWKAEQATD